MAYNANIPVATDYQDQSQAQIFGNFQSLGAFFDPDSQTFLTPIYFNSLLSPPAAAPVLPDPGQVGLWANTGVTSTVPELWFARSAGTPVAFTESVQAANGWTALPSGIIMQWGSVSVAANTQSAIVFTPNFTNVFSVTATIVNKGSGFTGGAFVNSVTTAGANVYYWKGGPDSTNIIVNWFAVGN